jgi:uracil-DNA glycosylase
MPDPQSLRGPCGHLLAHLRRLGIDYLPRAVALPGGALAGEPLAEERERVAVSPSETAASETAASETAGRETGTRETVTRETAPGAAPPPPRPHELAAPPASTAALHRPRAGAVDLPSPERLARLESLAQQVAGCTRCHELACTRNRTVFGEGNPAARVCFFGEAPGADEDRQGRPFVGAAGQLLTRMIEAATFRREDVYILNTLKCRPPGNRTPLPEEIANCRPYFETQFELIRPEYIVCLGLVAAQSLLDTKLSVGRLRGRFHAYGESAVLVTYHPAYLLRNPAAKQAAWEDLKRLMQAMDIPIPKRN